MAVQQLSISYSLNTCQLLHKIFIFCSAHFSASMAFLNLLVKTHSLLLAWVCIQCSVTTALGKIITQEWFRSGVKEPR